MASELNLTVVFHAPNLREIHEVMERWRSMKVELGEPIRPKDIDEELVPLIVRLYSCEVR